MFYTIQMGCNSGPTYVFCVFEQKKELVRQRYLLFPETDARSTTTPTRCASAFVLMSRSLQQKCTSITSTHFGTKCETWMHMVSVVKCSLATAICSFVKFDCLELHFRHFEYPLHRIDAKRFRFRWELSESDVRQPRGSRFRCHQKPNLNYFDGTDVSSSVVVCHPLEFTYLYNLLLYLFLL